MMYASTEFVVLDIGPCGLVLLELEDRRQRQTDRQTDDYFFFCCLFLVSLISKGGRRESERGWL